MPKKEGKEVKVRKELSVFIIIALFVSAFLIALNQRIAADISQPAPNPSTPLLSEEELNKIFSPKSPATSLYKLNPNFKNLKVESWWQGPIEQATLSSSLTTRDLTTGEVHFIQLYSLYNPTIPYQIVDVNLDTKEYRVVDGGPGRPDPCCLLLHPNGKIYITNQINATLVSYDFKSGEVKTIYRFNDGGTQSWSLGPDLALYFGTTVKGKVIRYDPTKDPQGNGNPEAITDFGIIADPGPPYYRYVYTIASDGRYIYTAVRDQYGKPNIWALVIKEMATGKEQKFWQEIPATYMKVSYDHQKGYATGSYSVEENGKVVGYSFKLNGFNPPEPLTANTPNNPNPPTQFPSGYPPAASNYTIDTSDLLVDSSTEGKATLRWKKSGEQTWQELTIPGIRMRAAGITIPLLSLGNNQLVGFGENHGCVFLFDTAKHSKVSLGNPRVEIYKAFYSQIHKKVYFVGYPSAWKEWDPQKPWSPKRESLVEVNPNNNPHYMPRPNQNSSAHIMAKYYLHITEGRDGLLYLAGAHERDSTGSSFFWYNPKLSYRGSVDLPLPFVNNENYGVLREEFKDGPIRGIANALYGSKIVIDYGKTLFLFDTASKKIEKVLPGSYGRGAIVEVEPGIVLKADYQTNTLYKIDIRTGEVLATKEIPSSQGAVFGGAIGYYGKDLMEFVWGPDHYIWLFIGNSIYRINPSGRSIEPEKVIDVGFPGYITFDSNNDLYITNRGPNIWVIKDLFVRKSQEELLASADYSLYTEKTNFSLNNQDSLTIPLKLRLETAMELPSETIPPLTLSIENLPKGINASFSKESCQGSCETSLSLSNLNSLTAGEHRLTLLLHIPSLNREPKKLTILLNKQKSSAALAPPTTPSTPPTANLPQAPSQPQALSKPEIAATPKPQTTAYIPLVQSLTKSSSKESQTTNIRLLQETLIAYGYLRGRATGDLNLTTRLALSRFRKEYSLRTPRGNILIDEATASAINNLRTKKITIPTLTTRSSYYYRARVIRLVQARLIELGYLKGRPNGILNSATKKALINFRKANALLTPSKGIIIDAATAWALNSK